MSKIRRWRCFGGNSDYRDPRNSQTSGRNRAAAVWPSDIRCGSRQPTTDERPLATPRAALAVRLSAMELPLGHSGAQTPRPRHRPAMAVPRECGAGGGPCLGGGGGGYGVSCPKTRREEGPEGLCVTGGGVMAEHPQKAGHLQAAPEFPTPRKRDTVDRQARLARSAWALLAPPPTAARRPPL